MILGGEERGASVSKWFGLIGSSWIDKFQNGAHISF